MPYFFFFFQAEDGIRDWSVTGVQTCALPIWQRCGAGEDRGDEGVLLAEIRPRGERRRIARGGQLILGFQHATRSESRIDAEQVPEASNQQASASQQHDRERQLAGDEDRPERRPRAAEGAAA